MNKKITRFSASMRILHWAMAALIISLLSAGMTMVKSLEVWQLELLTLHKATGLLVAVLVVVRLVNRWCATVPALPDSLPRWQKTMALGSHYALYCLMILMPLTGFLMQYYGARPIAVFSWFTLPSALYPDIELYALYRQLHGFIGYTLAVLILVHVLAALQHHFIRKDGVLKSML
ncbi:cytochrome b [Pseudoalteromonas sp. T1lg75]|uniref:cytochrome b n=1 Tax=Pseudoalteromonas sp. T1lg75 TaxID=2077102 RepID=UPI000CF6FD2F|nr:cytochrome b [Pseudoalteromonas sp. T1lg75]